MLWIILLCLTLSHLWSASPWKTAINSASVLTRHLIGMTLKCSIYKTTALQPVSQPSNNLDFCADPGTSTEAAAESLFTPGVATPSHPSGLLSALSLHCRVIRATPGSINGKTATPLHLKPDRKRGVDFSLLRPLQSTSPSTLKIELFNTQSLTNKSCLIHNHYKNINIMCLTETWHQPEAYFVLNEACPPGYSYLERARRTGRGGGLAVIYRSDLKLSPLSLPEPSTFECLAFKSKPPFPVTVLLIYRPPKPNQAFIPEINELLTTLCTTSAHTVILGDLNIHVDTPSCHPAAEFYWTVFTSHSMLMFPHTTEGTHWTWSLLTLPPSQICQCMIWECQITKPFHWS